MQRGYDAVAMREIAEAVGKFPVQVYRLNLSKADILAEVIIELNDEQLARIPELSARCAQTSRENRIYAYLRELYVMDIECLPIRSVGAAYGWMWSREYEKRVTEQVRGLVEPVIQWLQEAELDGIPSRVMGIWSLYYVGYRRAVIHGGSADDCIETIRPSLAYFLK